MSIPLKRFYFIRHGETDWNKNHVSMGQTDIPLNSTGIEQAIKASKLLKNFPFKSIVTSPLKRAYETAQIIHKEHTCPLIVMDGLKEACLGIQEGQPKGDCKWETAWKDGASIEKAESFHEFTFRVKKTILEALTLPDPILIVAHGGVYWALQQAFGFPFLDLPNCLPVCHEPPLIPNNPWRVYELLI